MSFCLRVSKSNNNKKNIKWSKWFNCLQIWRRSTGTATLFICVHILSWNIAYQMKKCNWKKAKSLNDCDFFCLKDTDVLVWKSFPPQEICLLLYYLTLITPHPPFWGSTRWEEANGISSMKWWQDWAHQVWTSTQSLSWPAGWLPHMPSPQNQFDILFSNLLVAEVLVPSTLTTN